MNKKNLVFTSVGDNNVVSSWCDSESYDVWACYYGDKIDIPIEKRVDRFFRRKGGKLQNFHYLLKNCSKDIWSYENILLADDDIVISKSEIENLFDIREEIGVKALQPSFDVRGKISHPITKVRPLSRYRTTNFLEITFVLFESHALREFMENYDPIVNCWGVDWWFSYDIIKKYGVNSLAIIDQIKCINPHDRKKPSGSEIAKLSSLSELSEKWKEFQSSRKIVTDYKNYKVYKKVDNFNFCYLFSYIGMYFLHIFTKLIEKVMSKLDFK